MAAPKRSSAQIDRDRAEIARLYCQGIIQVEIAQRLDMTQQMVSYDLKAIRQAWRDSAMVDFNEARAEELAKIDTLELTYWEAWRHSCEDAETIVKKQKESGGKEMQQTLKGQAGDPRFLQGVQWCIERRCKLLGLDIEIGSGEDKPFVVKVLKSVTTEVL